MSRLDRRRFLTATAGLAGATAFSTVLGSRAFAQDVSRIRHAWWGNPERDKRTFAAIEIFNEAHPEIEVVGETLGFNDYFTRLATQIAGGNMPDVIQQGYGVMQEYVDRGTMLPLDEYVGKTLDLSNLDQSAIDSGMFNGKLYGISIGANALVTVYNERMIEEAGVEFDPITWNYEDLRRVAVAVSEATPEGVYGTDDGTADWASMNIFAIQNGFNPMWAEDGKDFAFDVDLIVEYWNMWKDIRDAGGTPPGAESAALAGQADLTVQGIVTGQTAMSYLYSNQIVGVQDLMEDSVGAAMRPHLEGGQPGTSIAPSQFVALSRDTVDAEAATTYMSAFINDPEITAVLGLERGIPAVSTVREALQGELSPAERITVEYFDAIQDHVAPLGPPNPPGAREVEEAFERLAVNVLLDRQSIEDTANQFMQEARAILRRA